MSHPSQYTVTGYTILTSPRCLLSSLYPYANLLPQSFSFLKYFDVEHRYWILRVALSGVAVTCMRGPRAALEAGRYKAWGFGLIIQQTSRHSSEPPRFLSFTQMDVLVNPSCAEIKEVWSMWEDVSSPRHGFRRQRTEHETRCRRKGRVLLPDVPKSLGMRWCGSLLVDVCLFVLDK